MKNVTILIAIFLVFFVKNTVVAQTKESKFSAQVEPLSGKKVLFYNGHLFLGNKDDAEKFSGGNFISNTNDNIFVLKVFENGQITKSVFLRKNYKWFLVMDDLVKNFVVSTKERDVTTVVTITYDNGDSEERFF